MVIDRRLVILELYQYDNSYDVGDDDPLHYKRGLVLHGSQALVDEYVRMWRRLNMHPMTRTPHLSELRGQS